MNKKILIIDDDDDILAVLRISLEKFAGWKTVLANSGKEGLIKAKIEGFDAIILDISMPEMDGFQVYEKLKADPLTKTIPIILLTAKVTTRDYQKFSDLDIAGVINKPFNPVSIWQQITDLVKIKSA